jgi:hypothetical protein
MRVCGRGWWRGLVRLCGYMLTKLAHDLLFIYSTLDSETDRVIQTGRYDEDIIKSRVRELENLANTVRFLQPACPVLRLEDINTLKQDIMRAVGRLKSAVEKRDVSEVEVALLEVTPDVGDVLFKLNKYFIEK